MLRVSYPCWCRSRGALLVEPFRGKHRRPRGGGPVARRRSAVTEVVDIIEFSICFEEKHSIASMANGPYGEYGHWDAMTNKRIAAAR